MQKFYCKRNFNGKFLCFIIFITEIEFRKIYEKLFMPNFRYNRFYLLYFAIIYYHKVCARNLSECQKNQKTKNIFYYNKHMCTVKIQYILQLFKKIYLLEIANQCIIFHFVKSKKAYSQFSKIKKKTFLQVENNLLYYWKFTTISSISTVFLKEFQILYL